MTARVNLKEHFTKQRLTSNIGLKILSLFVAIILWVVVVNVTDPIVPKEFKNVPVRIINSDVITDNGKTYEVINDSAIISTVTVKASRTTIQELGSNIDSIVATADLRDLSSDGTSVPIEITTSKLSDKIDTIKASSNTLYLSIENRKTIQLPLSATTSGEIESGYILGNVKPAQNQVRVSGPESLIDTIKSASVDVQVTGFTSDISTQSEIMLYDSEGEAISKNSLTLNVESVKVDVEILATKRVPIYYATSGIPADGYEATGEVTVSPDTVVIAGSSSQIGNVSTINIPATELNLTGQTENLLSVLKISDYLPTGIRLADSSSNGTVSITVYIEKLEENTFGTYLRNVSIINIPEGFEGKIVGSEDSVEFKLRGLAQNLEKVQLSSLNCRVDFDDYSLLNDTTEFKKGTYTCYLVMDLPEGVEAVEPVAIEVELTEKDN